MLNNIQNTIIITFDLLFMEFVLMLCEVKLLYIDNLKCLPYKLNL